jgi:hypothetical protein
VGRGGAQVALDRGSEAVRAADDGGQEWQWRSGEARDRERENGREIAVQEQKKRCIWSSRHALSFERGRRGRETLLGSTACMAATGEVRAEAGVAWRAKKKAAGRAMAAAGRGATRGVAKKQEVARIQLPDGERRRRTARADGRRRGTAGRS